jgi:hypothetical protein
MERSAIRNLCTIQGSAYSPEGWVSDRGSGPTEQRQKRSRNSNTLSIQGMLKFAARTGLGAQITTLTRA